MADRTSTGQTDARETQNGWLAGDAPSSFGALMGTALLLAGEGVAFALALESLLLGDRLADLIAQNTLATETRNRLLLGLVLGALVPLLATVLGSRGRVEATWSAARNCSRWLMPLLPLAVYPALFQAHVWFRQPLTYLLILAGFAVLLERCLSAALAAAPATRWPRWRSRLSIEPRRAARLSLATVCCAAIAYAAYTGYLTILNHYRFGTGAFDLAIYDNLMFNALKGHPFRSTILYGDRGGNSLGGHSEYGMLLFLPFYAMKPAAETLLVLQALLFGLGAIPLHLFAATLLPRWQATLIALAYLMYAPLHGAQFYDFHWLPLATFFLFLAFYAIARSKNWLLAFAVFVLFALREDVAPGVAVIGVYLMLSTRRARLGALLALVSSAWFVTNKFVIMPAFGSWWFDQLYKDLVAPGEKGWGSIIRTMLVNPLYVVGTLFTQAKLEYALHLLAPLAFLPLRRKRLFWFLLPGLVFTLMTTGYGATTSIAYQYSAHWIAYLFGATVLALNALQRCAPRLALSGCAALLLALVSHSAVFGVVLVPSSFIGGIKPIEFSLTAEERQRYEDVRELISLIPANASVTVTDFEAPHLSNRSDVFAIGQDDSAGEYLLVQTERLPLAATRQHVRKLLREKPYGLVARKDSWLFLFRQGEKNAQSAAAINDLLRQ